MYVEPAAFWLAFLHCMPVCFHIFVDIFFHSKDYIQRRDSIHAEIWRRSHDTL